MCISCCTCVSLLHTRDTHLQMSLTCRNTHLHMSLVWLVQVRLMCKCVFLHVRLICKCVFLHVRLICKCVSLVCKRDTHLQREIHICKWVLIVCMSLVTRETYIQLRLICKCVSLVAHLLNSCANVYLYTSDSLANVFRSCVKEIHMCNERCTFANRSDMYVYLSRLCKSHVHMCISICQTHLQHVQQEMHICNPPKNGEIALLLTTNGLMCSKYVSQKRNEAIDNSQWYNVLLNFILWFAGTLY